jgi:hypothetical protein
MHCMLGCLQRAPPPHPDAAPHRARAQVYGFGGVSCVVDSAAGVVRAQLDGRWAPASLEALLAAARTRGRGL